MGKKFSNALFLCVISVVVLLLVIGCDSKKNTKVDELPTFTTSWGPELHTGNMQLYTVIPESFEGNDVRLKPVSTGVFELLKDEKPMAYIKFVPTKGGADAVALMGQGHLDIAFCSSTAAIAGYDSGIDLSILCPIQSGGVSIVADINAPYNTFEELVEYAKKSDQPIKGGYHSAVSSPRIVLEYALKDAGLDVSEDSSKFNADVLLMDLKGGKNLIPSMHAGQVDIWAAPIPIPENAVDKGVGKIIARLEDLPGGKWIDFPCCAMNVRNDIKLEHPEIVEAMFKAQTYVAEFANKNRKAAAEALSEYVGMEVRILMQNKTNYSTRVTEKFTNGMKTYQSIMADMGKFKGRLSGSTFEEAMEKVFDFSYANKFYSK